MHLKISFAKWQPFCSGGNELTHWGRVTHICVVKLTIIGSDNGLSPGRRQAIIWTNTEILLFGPLGTNFIEILNGIQTFSFKKMHLQMSSAKWRPLCLGLNVLSSVNIPVSGGGGCWVVCPPKLPDHCVYNIYLYQCIFSTLILKLHRRF